MLTQNVNITGKASKVLRFAFCAPATGSFGCTSFPVFSLATNDGTSRYEIDTPLKQLSPPGLFRTENFPTVAYDAASGTGTITFNYGATFAESPDEHEAASSPRRYKFFLHRAGSPPGTAFSSTYTALSGMILGGTVNVFAGPVTATSIVDVCSVGVS